MAQVTGEDGYGMRQVPRSSTKTRQRKSQNWSREKWRFEDPKGSTPNLEEIWGYRRRFLSKKKKFDKNFHHFHTLFGRERDFLSPKAAAPSEQYSAKKRMARQQSDELEKTKRELLGTAQPLRRRRQPSARPRRDSGLIVR